MALGTTDIGGTAIATELAITLGSDRLDSSLTNHSTINKWSFCRPRPISISSYAVALGTHSDNINVGNFRKYNHLAAQPTCSSSFELNYITGATNLTVEIDVDLKEFNILEAIPSVTPYFATKYYSSTSARTARTGAVRTNIVSVDLKTVTPLSGHSNDQTQAPDSPQLITDTSVPASGVSATPDGYIYAETYISDVSGAVIMYLPGGGYTDILCHRLALPKILAYGPEFALSGYDTVYVFVNNSSSSTESADVEVSVNTDNASFYFFLVGARDGTGYRLGSSSFSGKMVVGTTEYTLNASNLGAGTSNKLETTDTMWGTYDTWAYGDVGVVEVVSISGVVEGDEVSLT